MEEKFMNKKIIALALALAILCIATAFTACKRGPELTEINGNEYPLATNKDGETIINQDNQIAVLVTDRDNEVITYENGEDQTHWMQITGPMIIGDRVQTEQYTLGIPKGWEANNGGRVIKKGTDEKCYIHFIQNSTIMKQGSLENYIENLDKQNEEVAAAMEKEGYKVETTEDTASITMDNYSAVIRTYKITDSSGNVLQYAENYYFVADARIYSINYVCEEGKGYDDKINFAEYIAQNFEFRSEEKK